MEVIQERYPVELRIRYQRLVDEKLLHGISPDQESELEEIRVAINATDWHSQSWNQFETAVGHIDQHITGLRRTIESFPLNDS